MCNADVKINKGSSGFPTTFILFRPTTVFFLFFVFPSTRMTIDAKRMDIHHRCGGNKYLRNEMEFHCFI